MKKIYDKSLLLILIWKFLFWFQLSRKNTEATDAKFSVTLTELRMFFAFWAENWLDLWRTQCRHWTHVGKLSSPKTNNCKLKAHEKASAPSTLGFFKLFQEFLNLPHQINQVCKYGLCLMLPNTLSWEFETAVANQ